MPKPLSIILTLFTLLLCCNFAQARQPGASTDIDKTKNNEMHTAFSYLYATVETTTAYLK